MSSNEVVYVLKYLNFGLMIQGMMMVRTLKNHYRNKFFFANLGRQFIKLYTNVCYDISDTKALKNLYGNYVENLYIN